MRLSSTFRRSLPSLKVFQLVIPPKLPILDSGTKPPGRLTIRRQTTMELMLKTAIVTSPLLLVMMPHPPFNRQLLKNLSKRLRLRTKLRRRNLAGLIQFLIITNSSRLRPLNWLM